MKRVISLLFIFLMLLMCSCGAQSDTAVPDGTALFESDAADYTFCYPQAWRVSSQNGISSVEMTTTGGRTAKISVMAFDCNEASVNDYWKTYEGDIGKTFSGYTPVELEKGELMLDDAPAKAVAYTASYGASENVYRFDQVLCLRKGIMYIITFSSLKDDHDAYSSALDTVTSYFKFK